MSCGNTDFEGGHCVTDVVKGIVKAQHQAVEAEEDNCLTGCDRSIEDLLSPYEENRDRLRYNTIPFILYCKQSCKPFIGSGVRRGHSHGRNSKFECVETPIFRVKTFVRGSDNCVRLELLKPVRDKGKDSGSSEHHQCCQDLCNFFDGDVNHFRATGICITVDLNSFIGISCLDPIFVPLRPENRHKH